MLINDIINANNLLQTGSECAPVDRVEIIQTVLQETEPYALSKSIIGENIYEWNKKFIDKVMQSFVSTVVQNFSKKEKDLFDRYTNFLIYGVVDITEEDVIELDTYIGTIKGDYIV